MSLKAQALQGTFWSAVEKFSLMGVQFLLQIVLARLLTPTDYGIVGILAVFLAIARAFIDCGFTSALVQNQKRTEEDFSTAFYFNVVISTVFYVFLFITAPYIAQFYKMPILVPVTRVLTLSLPISALAAVNRTKLQIAVDFKTQMHASLSSVILSGVIGIILAYRGFGVWALVVQSVLSAMFNTVLLFYLVKWKPLLCFSINSFKRMFGYGSKLLAASLLDVLYFNMYPLVIGKLFSAADLGLYSRASGFAHLPPDLTSGIVSRVTFPVFSQIQNDMQRLFSVYKKYLIILASIYAPLVLGLCAIAKPLLLTLIGEKWTGAVILLQILCIASVADCLIHVNLNLLFVKGYTGAVLKLNIIKRMISFSILIVSLPFGIKGLCIGQVFYGQIALFLNTYYTKKILNLGYWEQIKAVLPPYSVAFISVLPAFGITFLPISSFWQLVFGISSAVVVYLFITYWLKFDIWKEAISFYKQTKMKSILLEKLSNRFVPFLKGAGDD